MVDFSNMKNKPDTPKVGVGIILVNDGGEIFLMRRQGSHGPGEWSLPGGHLELGEDEFTCCARELKEETGLTLTKLTKHTFCNNVFESEGLHYITLFYFGEYEGNAKNMEPAKCDAIGWFPINNLPSPLFGALNKIFGDRKLKEQLS